MKKLIVLFSLIVPFAYAQHDNASLYGRLVGQADSLYRAKEYVQSSRTFAKAFAFTEQIKPTDLYNGACAAAKAGDTETAFERLRRRTGMDKDWYSETIGADNDLLSLHADPRWKVLMDTLANRQERIERYYDKPLRSELKEIMQKDQEIRLKYLEACNASPVDTPRVKALATEMAETDSLNLMKISRILDTHGWVGRKQVGDACGAFWLVIQHSPLDVQKKYFPLLQQAAREGDISPLNIAMLEDRIAVREGRPQKYGSQILRHNDGTYYVAPLLDPTRVDQWRKEAGMPPLAVYAKRWGIDW